MRPKATTKDLYAALGATVVGGLFLFLALHAKWNPQEMSPGIEGTLCAGVMGTVLALLAKMDYRLALWLSAPVMLVEYAACAFAGGPAVGVVALHLIIAGFIGLALALREPRLQEASDHAPAAPAEDQTAGQHG